MGNKDDESLKRALIEFILQTNVDEEDLRMMSVEQLHVIASLQKKTYIAVSSILRVSAEKFIEGLDGSSKD